MDNRLKPNFVFKGILLSIDYGIIEKDNLHWANALVIVHPMFTAESSFSPMKFNIDYASAEKIDNNPREYAFPAMIEFTTIFGGNTKNSKPSLGVVDVNFTFSHIFTKQEVESFFNIGLPAISK
jgi:hypothetical protein